MQEYLPIIQEAFMFPLQGMKWVFMGELTTVVPKIALLFLPMLFVLAASWITMLSLPTLLFRQFRTKFVATFLITWWDGGRAILLYWSGLLKFIFLSVGWVYSVLRIIVMGTYQTLKDIIFSPITILTSMAKGYATPGIPWIAVSITFLWIALEASIFTFILTPLVNQILYGMTNMELPLPIITSGLFVFLFLVVGGSLACMYALVDALEKGRKATVAKMLLIEFVVMSVEVVFFYREFVEALLPFFNRMTEGELTLGAGAILAIAAFAWIGIRSSIWFFFGKYGTPTLLSVISREGIYTNGKNQPGKFPIGQPMVWIKQLTHQLQAEINWFTAKGVEILEAFILPPTQLLAVITNFAMLMLTSKVLFSLPVRSVAELKDTNELVLQVTRNLQEQ